MSVTHVSNALGTILPVREIVELAHDRGVPVHRRRRPVGGAHAGRRAGDRLRLLRLLVAQDVRPDRLRRALRQAPLARRDAAVPGRRRHDFDGVVRGEHLGAGAAQVRGGHAEHRRRRRLRRRGRLPAPLRPRRDRRARARPARVRHGAPRRDARAAHHRHRRAQVGRPVVRDGRHPPARHRHRARPGRRRHPHRPALRPAGDGSLRHPGHRAHLVRPLQHARRHRRDDSRRSTTSGNCSAERVG